MTSTLPSGVCNNWVAISPINTQHAAKEVFMVSKFPILEKRVRRVPRQFSWVDQRLVREQYINRLSHPAAALYLFLVTVSDAQGMSYYADTSIRKRLSMDPATLDKARDKLVRIGLIAWENPLYQVLSLDPVSPPPRPAMAQAESLGEIFKQAMGGL